MLPPFHCEDPQRQVLDSARRVPRRRRTTNSTCTLDIVLHGMLDDGMPMERGISRVEHAPRQLDSELCWFPNLRPIIPSLGAEIRVPVSLQFPAGAREWMAVSFHYSIVGACWTCKYQLAPFHP